MYRMFNKFFFLLLAAIHSPIYLHAAITVDPDGVGADDVTVNGLPIGLFSPLPDQLDLSGFDLNVGNMSDGRLIIDGGSWLSNQFGLVGFGADPSGQDAMGYVEVIGTGSQWNNFDNLLIGNQNKGILYARDGGMVTSEKNIVIGSNGLLSIMSGGRAVSQSSTLTGTAPNKLALGKVAGKNSEWVSREQTGLLSYSEMEITDYGSLKTDFLRISQSKLAISYGGSLTSHSGFSIPVPSNPYIPLTQSASVSLNSSQADLSPTSIDVFIPPFLPFSYYVNQLEIEMSSSELNLTEGGVIFSKSTQINREGGRNIPTATDILINGANTVWANRGEFSLGSSSKIRIEDHGLLYIGGTMTLLGDSTIELDEGNLHFGQTDVSSFNRIMGERGTMSGNILINGFNTMDDLPGRDISPNIDVSGVQLLNKGILYGDGTSRFGLSNAAEGVVNLLPEERMIFHGASSNSGLITILGGHMSSLGLQGSASTSGFTNNHLGEVLIYNGQLDARNITNYGLIEIRGGKISAAFTDSNDPTRPAIISNNGLLEFTGGESEVNGIVNNFHQIFYHSPYNINSIEHASNSSMDFTLNPFQNGSIEVSNFATVTFLHEVVGGDITVYYGSEANFLGGLSGGGVEGQGKVFIDGHLEPRSGLAVPTPFIPTNDTTASYDEWYIAQPPSPTVHYLLIPDSMNFGGDVELGDQAVVDLAVFAQNQLFRGADSIHVAGEFILNGELELSITSFDGLLPEDTFTLITAGNLAGEFDAVYGRELDGPLEWELTQTDTELFITAILPGDFNNDWVVDAADFTLWRDNLANGQTAAIASDFNTKMQSDYEAWHANYGVRFERPGINDLSSAVGIPEPSTSLLLISLVAMSACKESRTK